MPQIIRVNEMRFSTSQPRDDLPRLAITTTSDASPTLIRSDTGVVRLRISLARVRYDSSGARRRFPISRGILILLLTTLLTTGCWRGKVLSAESGALPQPTPDATVSSIVRLGARSPIPAVSPTPAQPTADPRATAPSARAPVTPRSTSATAPRAQPTPTRAAAPPNRAAGPTTSAAPATPASKAAPTSTTRPVQQAIQSPRPR